MMRAVPPQVLWRCRRGMKELDVLLERFARERYAELGPARRASFERLLEHPDPELAAWLLGSGSAPDAELAALVGLIALPPRCG